MREFSNGEVAVADPESGGVYLTAGGGEVTLAEARRRKERGEARYFDVNQLQAATRHTTCVPHLD
jgi:hypothetical protein